MNAKNTLMVTSLCVPSRRRKHRSTGLHNIFFAIFLQSCDANWGMDVRLRKWQGTCSDTHGIFKHCDPYFNMS